MFNQKLSMIRAQLQSQVRRMEVRWGRQKDEEEGQEEEEWQLSCGTQEFLQLKIHLQGPKARTAREYVSLPQTITNITKT